MNDGNNGVLLQEKQKKSLMDIMSLLFEEGAIEIIAVLSPDGAGIDVAAAGKKQSLELDINGNWLLVRMPEEEVAAPGLHFVKRADPVAAD